MTKPRIVAEVAAVSSSNERAEEEAGELGGDASWCGAGGWEWTGGAKGPDTYSDCVSAAVLQVKTGGILRAGQISQRVVTARSGGRGVEIPRLYSEAKRYTRTNKSARESVALGVGRGGIGGIWRLVVGNGERVGGGQSGCRGGCSRRGGRRRRKVGGGGGS